MTSAQKGEGVKKCSTFADKQYRFCRQSGVKGVKNAKILWMSYMEAPLPSALVSSLSGKRSFSRRVTLNCTIVHH